MKASNIILILTALCLPVSAQQKVSDRTSLAAAALAPATDILPIVDISAGLSGSKKITIDDLFTGWGMTASGATLAKAANAAAQRTALGLGTAATAASTAFEPALGNPGTDGHVLSSTTAGVRSWIAPGSGGGGDIASQAEAEAGTENTKTMTPLRTAQAITALGVDNGSDQTIIGQKTWSDTAYFPTSIVAGSISTGGLTTNSLSNTAGTTLSGSLDVYGDTTLHLASAATGDLFYRNAGGALTRLGIGSSNQYLKVTSGLPSWATFPTVGDVLAANNLSDLASAATARTNLGLAIGTNVQAWDADLSSWAGVTRASGFDTFSGTPTSANLAGLVTNELGSGNLLFGDQPVTASSTVTFSSLTTTDLEVNGLSYLYDDLNVGGSISITGVYSGNGSGLTNVNPGNFTGALFSSSPNATTPAARLIATNAATNVDAVFSSKGTGALLANVPDNASTGGNKRGANAVDLQQVRSAATSVASGQESVIAGGFRNTASNSRSTVSGGISNIASGSGSAVAGGNSNTSSGEDSFTAGDGNTASGAEAFAVGLSNTATGLRSMTLGQSNINSGDAALVTGTSNTATHNQSMVMGSGAVSRIQQGFFQAAGNIDAVSGSAQVGTVVLRLKTTTATTAPLTTTSGGGVVEITLTNNSTYSFTGQLAARSSTGDSAAWRFSGTIERGANAAATALVGTPTITDTNSEAGSAAWTVAIVADTTGGALRFNVTGAAATNIRWVARVETAEVVH